MKCDYCGGHSIGEQRITCSCNDLHGWCSTICWHKALKEKGIELKVFTFSKIDVCCYCNNQESDLLKDSRFQEKADEEIVKEPMVKKKRKRKVDPGQLSLF